MSQSLMSDVGPDRNRESRHKGLGLYTVAGKLLERLSPMLGFVLLW